MAHGPCTKRLIHYRSPKVTEVEIHQHLIDMGFGLHYYKDDLLAFFDHDYPKPVYKGGHTGSTLRELYFLGPYKRNKQRTVDLLPDPRDQDLDSFEMLPFWERYDYLHGKIDLPDEHCNLPEQIVAPVLTSWVPDHLWYIKRSLYQVG